MKKLLSFLLIFLIFVPTIWAYDLTDKDRVIVLRASSAIEKMITRKWETYRSKYVVALQKLQLRFQDNPRMQKIIGETANVLSDDTSGLENVFTNADTSVNSPVVDVPKKETVPEKINSNPINTTNNSNTVQNVAVTNQVTVRKCYMESGEWQETYSNNTWGSCGAVSCNNSFHKEWNLCIVNQVSCSIEGWAWYKIWNGSWSNCNINQCNSWFEQLNNKCLQKCSSLAHREWEICVNNPVAILDIKRTDGLSDILLASVNISGAKGVPIYGVRFSSIQGNTITLSKFSVTIASTALPSVDGDTSLTLYINGIAKSTKTISNSSVNFDWEVVVNSFLNADIVIKADFNNTNTSGTFSVASISYDAVDIVSSYDVIKKPSIAGAVFTLVPVK